MMSENISINPAELISFFDEKPFGSIGHANALIAVLGESLCVGLLKKFLIARGDNIEIIPGTPTMGTRSGRRLDAWMLQESAEGRCLLQIEVKNWNSHSYNGKIVSGDISRFSKIQWNDVEKYWLELPDVRKVLLPMRPPRAYSHLRAKPILCLWPPMHPDGKTDPFFDINVEIRDGEVFDRLSIFSASNFLRGCSEEWISIDLLHVEERINFLNRFVKIERL